MLLKDRLREELMQEGFSKIFKEAFFDWADHGGNPFSRRVNQSEEAVSFFTNTNLSPNH